MCARCKLIGLDPEDRVQDPNPQMDDITQINTAARCANSIH